ncbi:MAG: ABC transporter ATP-binding protein [Deltaproteobacteria bacterium]|nr:ABC transporter ATP-binding protein [Deltaproteobacteria bacterium]
MHPPPRPGAPTPRIPTGTALRTVIAQLPRTFDLVLESGRRDTLSLVVQTVLGGLLPLAVAWVGKLIVDGVVHAVSTKDPADLERALLFVGAELGLMVVMAWNTRGTTIARSVLGARLGYLTNVRILEKAQSLDLAHFEDPSVYDKLQNARREASSRPLGLFLKITGIGKDLLSLLSYGAVLIGFSPLALLILLLATIPSLIAEAKFSGEAFQILTWRAPEGRRLNYYEWVLTRDGSVKEVKLYGLGRTFLDRYRALYLEFFDAERRLAVKRSSVGFGLGVLASLAFYGVYGWIVVRTVQGQLTLGDMTMLLMIFRQAQGALRGVLGALSGAYEDSLFMSNLFTFLDLPTTERAALAEGAPAPAAEAPAPATEAAASATEAPAPATEAAAPLRTGFVLEGVCFSYPGTKKAVLDGLDLTIGPTEKLAIVGENGAGKTTLIKLLTGLYQPTAGRISLDGVPLREIPPEVLRAKLGVVLQDFVRYQLTARENVGFGAVDAMDDRARLDQAAERGGAREVISGLAAGWETQLGRWFDGGTELAAGQWQKIAVSRAFMRDAPILVLDEPTASLDAEAEHALFARFRALAAGRMAILISHRFSTVRMADRIAVLHEGRLLELGSHAELLARDGRYAHLFRLQAAGYLS